MFISISKSVFRYSFFFMLITILLFSGSTVHCQENDIRINEFMALNQTTLVDKDGGFEDWFEIYNPTAAAVDLADWSITDSGEEPRKWVFPQVTIQAGAYLVIPTTPVMVWAIVFYIAIEFQVRIEEEFLSQTHGNEYRNYFDRTKRYLPFLY